MNSQWLRFAPASSVAMVVGWAVVASTVRADDCIGCGYVCNDSVCAACYQGPPTTCNCYQTSPPMCKPVKRFECFSRGTVCHPGGQLIWYRLEFCGYWRECTSKLIPCNDTHPEEEYHCDWGSRHSIGTLNDYYYATGPCAVCPS